MRRVIIAMLLAAAGSLTAFAVVRAQAPAGQSADRPERTTWYFYLSLIHI